METVMERQMVAEIIAHFQALNAVIPLRPIRIAAHYDKAVSARNQLLDAGAGVEAHPLADLVATLGEIIGDYADVHYPNDDVTSSAMLRFLMEQRNLTQSDLPEVGTQGVVSEILRGIRALNIRQIKAVSARFTINPAAFF